MENHNTIKNVGKKTEMFVSLLKQELFAGNLNPGDKFPSESSLAEKYNVSRITVRRGLISLRHEGLLESKMGIGHFVPWSAKEYLKTDTQKTEVIYVHSMGENIGELTHLGKNIYEGAFPEAKILGFDLFFTSVDSIRLRQLIIKKRDMLAGILFDWNDPELTQFMINERVPFVVVEGDFDEFQVDSVIQDDVGGSMLALEHFTSLGHTKIAYLGSNDTWVHRRRREGAYRSHTLKEGKTIDENLLFFADLSSEESCLATCLRLLESSQKPTAIFVANQELLSSLLMAIKKLQIKNPKALSIIVWGDPGEQYKSFDFITWDKKEMGKLALRILNERRHGEYSGNIRSVIPTNLVLRGSSIKLITNGV